VSLRPLEPPGLPPGQARAYLAAIVESSVDAIKAKTLDGTIVFWNAATERMYGYPAEEAVGRSLSLIVPEGERAQVERSMARLRRGEPAERVVTVRRRKDGSLIDVAVTISPIRDASGSVRGVASIARDITEEKRVAAQLDRTLVDLERALEQARASEAATRRFLDDAAHQLRAPITNIRACAETLLRDVTPAERDRLLAAVVGETSRASRLMSGLLQMARLNQRPALHLEPCDLVALCQGEANRAQATAPGIEVVLDRDGAVVGRPELDRHAVREALANLLDNARRHAASRIEVAVGRQDGWVWVRVGDDGPGVGPGQEEAIFERFVSLDHRGGSGLGLPIARELARAHGGELSYEAKAFVLRLPAGGRSGAEAPRSATV
jgi:PAS domain S-box-containing protein